MTHHQIVPMTRSSAEVVPVRREPRRPRHDKGYVDLRLRAEDLMTRAWTVDRDDSLGVAAQRLMDSGHRVLVVVADGRPIGLLDERSLLAQWSATPAGSAGSAGSAQPVRRVGQLELPRVRGVMPHVEVSTLAALLRESRLPAVPVVGKDGRVIGVVGLREVLGVLARHDPYQRARQRAHAPW